MNCRRCTYLGAYVIKLINDDKLRENLIKKGLENSRQYRLGSIASKYIDIFSSIEK